MSLFELQLGIPSNKTWRWDDRDSQRSKQRMQRGIMNDQHSNDENEH